jgi:hypothetical protein
MGVRVGVRMGIIGITVGAGGAGLPLLLPHSITTKTKKIAAETAPKAQTGKILRGIETATGLLTVGGSTLNTPLTAPSKAAANSKPLLYLLTGSFVRAFLIAPSTEDGMPGFIDLIGGGSS